jgi:hypothetical protein
MVLTTSRSFGGSSTSKKSVDAVDWWWLELERMRQRG